MTPPRFSSTSKSFSNSGAISSHRDIPQERCSEPGSSNVLEDCGVSRAPVPLETWGPGWPCHPPPPLPVGRFMAASYKKRISFPPAVREAECKIIQRSNLISSDSDVPPLCHHHSSRPQQLHYGPGAELLVQVKHYPAEPEHLLLAAELGGLETSQEASRDPPGRGRSAVGSAKVG